MSLSILTSHMKWFRSLKCSTCSIFSFRLTLSTIVTLLYLWGDFHECQGSQDTNLFAEQQSSTLALSFQFYFSIRYRSTLSQERLLINLLAMLWKLFWLLSMLKSLKKHLNGWCFLTLTKISSESSFHRLPINSFSSSNKLFGHCYPICWLFLWQSSPQAKTTIRNI